MKKNWLLVSLLTGLVTLSACVPNESSSVNTGDLPSSESITSEETSSEITPEQMEKITPELYKPGNNFPLVRRNQGLHDLNSLGEKKVLVIPVEFEDVLAKNLPGGAENIRGAIQKTFFGKGGTDLPWESLSSFYEKSSFGNLKISGEVTEWWNCGYTLAQMSAKGGATATKILVGAALDWYKGINGPESTKQFDADGDGYVDAVYLIYSADIGGDPNTSDDDNMFWAFVYWTSDSPNVDSPNGHNYMFASWRFMFEMGYYNARKTLYMEWTDADIALGRAQVDAHTYIHETGHLLGLDDYYTYDDVETTHGTAGKDYGAFGGLDMMDYNIGDHNAWSKWMLDWAHPYWVKDSLEITIKPFATSGESVLLAGPSYAYEHLSEYLMLEYVTPEGVAAYDGTQNFAGAYPLYYNQAGLRVMHVDARLARYVYRNDSYKFSKYVTVTTDPKWGTGYTGLAHCNTASRNDPSHNFKLLALLEPNDDNRLAQEVDVQFRDGTTGKGYFNRANNDSLFQVGDSFGIDTYVDYTLHSGEALGFTFEVLAMNAQGVTLRITKL